MTRTRHARYSVRGAEDRLREYQLALENKDRPQWATEKAKEMLDNAREVFKSLADLDRKVRDACNRVGIPTHFRVEVLRIVRRMWRLAKAGAPQTQYCIELDYMARKYNMDSAVINQILSLVGLPTC